MRISIAFSCAPLLLIACGGQAVDAGPQASPEREPVLDDAGDGDGRDEDDGDLWEPPQGSGGTGGVGGAVSESQVLDAAGTGLTLEEVRNTFRFNEFLQGSYMEIFLEGWGTGAKYELSRFSIAVRVDESTMGPPFELQCFLEGAVISEENPYLEVNGLGEGCFGPGPCFSECTETFGDAQTIVLLADGHVLFDLWTVPSFEGQMSSFQAYPDGTDLYAPRSPQSPGAPNNEKPGP
jgi:hypothetical protein